MEYRGQPGAGTITLEVAVEEIDALEHVDAVTSQDGRAIFDAVGLPAPGPLPALAQHQQIAQKLHACTAPDEDGWVNERAHDLLDLQLAHRSYDGTLVEIRATCERLFAARRRHPWPPEVTVRDGWPQRYSEESAGLDAAMTLTTPLSGLTPSSHASPGRSRDGGHSVDARWTSCAAYGDCLRFGVPLAVSARYLPSTAPVTSRSTSTSTSSVSRGGAPTAGTRCRDPARPGSLAASRSSAVLRVRWR